MNLFDTHCHINDEAFDTDRDAVIERMRSGGVRLAVVVGDGARDPESAFALARTHDFLYAAVGVHPQDADKWTAETEEKLTRWMTLDKVVALGEIGLDYHYDEPARALQRDVFCRQLALAHRLDKPVILHIRDAHGDATEILRAMDAANTLPRCVMHCYGGSWESAQIYLKMGLYISFSGSVTFKNTPRLTEVAENMPLERMLIETDCPYMAPVPQRGKRNEPAFVAYTLTHLAAIRKIAPDALADITLENGKRFFCL